jgi:acetyl-CoA carboxylase carboxyl transferase subunit beta
MNSENKKDMSSNWFKRVKEGITTSTKEKKETPEGLWHKCDKCKTVYTLQEIQKLYWVCDRCSHHGRIGSEEYFQILFDDGKYKELDVKLISGDPLDFEDTKKYKDRVKATIKNTGLHDAIRTAAGKMDGHDFVIACMDFDFIGGSLGSVMGEKIARAIDHAIKIKAPFMIISKSGGARMMEAGFSLMQMAKVSGKLGQLAEAKLPYISMLTHPTTGGVTASFAMLGDLNIAEPEALIGFAGPRVVKETIGRDLPDGFQTSEFVLEHGFLDYIVHRGELRETLALSLSLLRN